MKRRAFLGAATAGIAGLAGCQGFGSDSRDSTYGVPERETTSTDDATERETTDTSPDVPGIDPTTDPEPFDPLSRAVSRGLGPEYRMAIADEPLSNHPGPGRFRVGFASKPTLSSPATVWIEFESTTAGSRIYEFGPSPPFSNYWASGTRTGSEGRSLLLVPIDDRPFPYGDVVPKAPTDGRWVATERLGSPEGSVESRTIELDSGMSIVGEYALLWHPDANPSTPWGTFVFQGADWTPASIAVTTWPPDAQNRIVSAFEDSTPPDLPVQLETRWASESSASSSSVFLNPGKQKRKLPFTVIAPAVENYSTATLRVEDWVIAKRHDDGWKRIGPFGPQQWDQPRIAPPGNSAGWEVTIDNEDGSGDTTTRTTVSGIGGGRYAVGATVQGIPDRSLESTPVVLESYGGSAETDVQFSTAVVAARVELDGDAASVTTSESLKVVDRQGDKITAELQREATERESSPSPFVLERWDIDGDPQELIPEQVNQLPALRNAVALFEDDVQEVRVRTNDWIARQPILAFGDDPLLRFSFGGSEFLGRIDSPE